MNRFQKAIRIPKDLWKKVSQKIRHRTFQSYDLELIKKDVGGSAHQTSLFGSKLPDDINKMINRLGVNETRKALKARIRFNKSTAKRKKGKYKGRKYSLSVNNLHPTVFQRAVDAYMNRNQNGLTVREICRAFNIKVPTFYNNLRHYRKNGELKHYQSELKIKR